MADSPLPFVGQGLSQPSQAPVLLSAQYNSNNYELSLTFDRTIDAVELAGNDIVVLVDGVEQVFSTPASIPGGSATVTVVMEEAELPGGVVTATWITPPTPFFHSGQGPAAAFTAFPVTVV